MTLGRPPDPSQFGFDFLDGGQAAAELLGQGFGELGLPGGDEG